MSHRRVKALGFEDDYDDDEDEYGDEAEYEGGNGRNYCFPSLESHRLIVPQKYLPKTKVRKLLPTNTTPPLTSHAEQLRLGTVQVKEKLGSEYSATDKEIQESLWHYYFDVDKTVTYIKSVIA
jgi:hypothetical protein